MIKFSKRQLLSYLPWIFLLVLFLLTPLGFHIKVFFARLTAVSPTELSPNDRVQLTDDHWELTHVNGTKVNFSDYKGRVTIVNFWATWCPPCIAEIPSFEKLAGDYQDSIAFFFVAEDDQRKVSAFIEKKELSFPVYFENTETPQAFRSKSIPATYVIDKTGQIVISKIGAADWNSEKTKVLLERLLKE